jgi:hypothetical protein
VKFDTTGTAISRGNVDRVEPISRFLENVRGTLYMAFRPSPWLLEVHRFVGDDPLDVEITRGVDEEEPAGGPSANVITLIF